MVINLPRTEGRTTAAGRRWPFTSASSNTSAPGSGVAPESQCGGGSFAQASALSSFPA